MATRDELLDDLQRISLLLADTCRQLIRGRDPRHELQRFRRAVDRILLKYEDTRATIPSPPPEGAR